MLSDLKKVTYLIAVVLLCSMTMVAAQGKDIVAPSVVINLPSRMLELYSGNTLIKEYSVAVGKPSTPTPIGQFTIIDMEKNPTWVPFGRDLVVPSGPDNPLGYRWMGFFELYGIHGTNEPWTIGQALSNGCIRMREEHAEELFEIVTKGTPVKVNYERIKVRIDSGGQATIGVYPDIYDRKVVSLWEVNEKLAAVGLKGVANETLLLKVIRDEADQQVPFAYTHKIKVNGKMLTERAVSSGNIRYVPIWAIAKALKSNIVWDEQTQIVWKGKQQTNGIVKGDVVYINGDSIKDLFYGDTFFNEAENCIEFDGLVVMVNGKFLGNDVEVVGGILAVPMLPLADAIGQLVTYDSVTHAFMFQGKPVPTTIIDEQPYIQITKINEYFNADLFLDTKKHVIEVTYPRQSS